jgi:prepilin peptidase CpaA
VEHEREARIRMTVSMLLIGLLPPLLVAAAFFDLASFRIPNALPAAMFLLFANFMLALALKGHAMSWTDTSLHVLAGAIALVAGMILFATGLVGGGDAKLFAAASLWLGWDAMYEYALIASLLGGVLTLGLIVFRRVPLPPILAAQPWLVRLAERDGGVPYGVALAVGALVVLPHADIMRLAAIS